MSPFRTFESFARTLAALAVIRLGLLPGLGAWLRMRDRRSAVNRTIDAWGRWAAERRFKRLSRSENPASRPIPGDPGLRGP